MGRYEVINNEKWVENNENINYFDLKIDKFESWAKMNGDNKSVLFDLNLYEESIKENLGINDIDIAFDKEKNIYLLIIEWEKKTEWYNIENISKILKFLWGYDINYFKKTFWEKVNLKILLQIFGLKENWNFNEISRNISPMNSWNPIINNSIKLKKIFKEDLSLEEIIKFLKDNPRVSIDNISTLKKVFWWDIEELLKSYNKIISKIEYFNFLIISDFYSTFKLEKDIDLLLQFIEKNKEININNLINIWKIFWENIELSCKILKELEEKNIDIYNFKKLRDIFWIEYIHNLLSLKDVKIPYFKDIFFIREYIKKDFDQELLLKILKEKKKLDLSDWKTIDLILNISNWWEEILKLIRTEWVPNTNIFKDPAIMNLIFILQNNLLISENIEDKLIIARNLFLKWIALNKENIILEKNILKKLIIQFDKKAIFNKRNIILTSHHEDVQEDLYYLTFLEKVDEILKNNILKKNKVEEIYKVISFKIQKDESIINELEEIWVISWIEVFKDKIKDPERFWRIATKKAIEKQFSDKNKKITFIHPEKNKESLKKAKEDTLKSIINTDIPMTFVFDWHWWPDWIYFSDWGFFWAKEWVKDSIDTVSIKSDEIVEALIKRSKLKIFKKWDNDILVFSDCFSHTLIRTIYEKLMNYNKENKNQVMLPYMLWASEFDATASSDPRIIYWNEFFWKAMKLWKFKNTTFWIIRNNQDNVKSSNPSWYVVDENNTPQQIF